MRRCFIPSLLTCIAFACGNPTYVGDDSVPFEAGYVPNYDDGGSEAGDAGSTDAGPPVCISDSGTQPDFTLDKSCVTLATCGAILHHVDCCDSVVIVGIDDGKLTEAQALETAWRTTLAQNCKACAACDAGPTVTEDGKPKLRPDAGAQVECIGAPLLCRTKQAP